MYDGMSYICVIGNFSSQMSEEELSFLDDRAYLDNRAEVTIFTIAEVMIFTMRSPRGIR